MTTGFGRMASRAFEQDTPEILEADFGKIRGSKPWIARTTEVPSWTDGEAGPVTVDNARTRGTNPPRAGRACPFPEFIDPESTSDSMISSMTMEEDGARATKLRHFSKYSSQYFLNLTDTPLQLTSD